MSIRHEYFAGIVLKDPDPKNLGRYKVHIPELQLRMPTTTGLWCRNRVHSYRVNSSESGVYGSYMPLQPGTYVVISISNDDYASASITRINISELDPDKDKPDMKDMLPFNVTDDCRDDIYVLLRTPKHDSVIAIVEDVPLVDTGTTRTEPPNSLHIYHNGSKVIMDDNGIHINASTGLSVTVGGDANIVVTGSCKLAVTGALDIDASVINLNSGTSGNAGYATHPDKEIRFRSADDKL